MDLLRTLSEDDLKKHIGLPFGPARQIINALTDSDTSATGGSDTLSSSSLLLLTSGNSS